MVFSEKERAFLDGAILGRVATVNAQGEPRVTPVGFRLNHELNVIEIGGHGVSSTRRWQDLQRNPNIAFVVDELVSTNPWTVRGIQIRGVARLLDAGGDRLGPGFNSEVIQIYPRRITSWGIESDGFSRHSRSTADEDVPLPNPLPHLPTLP